MLAASEETAAWYSAVGDILFKAHKLDPERYRDEWILCARAHDCWEGVFAVFEDLQGLEQWCEIAPFARFGFTSCPFDTLENILAVLQSPAAERLVTIQLDNTNAASELARALAAASLQSLRHLCLDGHTLGDEGVTLLAQALWAPQLRSLHLEGVNATYRGLEALGSSGRFTSLESLNYSGNTLNDEDALYVSAPFSFPSLQRLDLVETSMRQEVLTELLCEVGLFDGVRVLNLSLNESLGPHAVRVVAGAPYSLRNLEVLRMIGASLDAEAVKALERAMSGMLSRLVELHVADEDIDVSAQDALTNASRVSAALQRARVSASRSG
jgi:hypothetical protein